jgi:hypothetical protein
MAGLGKTPFRFIAWTLRAVHWEFGLHVWTGFELPSSWRRLPCYGAHRKRNILGFMRCCWSCIDLGAQDLSGFNGQNRFATTDDPQTALDHTASAAGLQLVTGLQPGQQNSKRKLLALSSVGFL